MLRVRSGGGDWPRRGGRPRPSRSSIAAAVIAVLTALAVGACGSAAPSSSPPAAGSTSSSAAATPSTPATTTTTAAVALPSVCPPAARAVIGRAFGVSVTARRGESAQATPQCVFRAGRRGRVTVIVDGFAQPYQRLERTQIEDAQQFGTRRLEALPTPVSSLGIDAYWFPTERKVMTTEGRRLISVFVIGRESPVRIRATAIAVARHYLGPNDPKAADPNGG